MHFLSFSLPHIELKNLIKDKISKKLTKLKMYITYIWLIAVLFSLFDLTFNLFLLLAAVYAIIYVSIHIAERILPFTKLDDAQITYYHLFSSDYAMLILLFFIILKYNVLNYFSFLTMQREIEILE